MKRFFGDLIYRISRSHEKRVYVNAYVNHGTHSLACLNWGDEINYWFLKDIITDKMRLYNESPIAFRTGDINYLIIGSTISLLVKPESIIWGAGCIDERQLPARPKKVLAVRGPLTKMHLNSLGINCPKIYGDPALLLSRYYRPEIHKKHKIGLIHHVADEQIKIPGCHLISMSRYRFWTDVIDEICSCDFIASSSLHGLIVAEAYGIPNVWVQSKELIGGHFKFHDFFQSLGKDTPSPVYISASTSVNKLLNNVIYRGGAEFDLTPLIEVAPFALTKPKYPFENTCV